MNPTFLQAFVAAVAIAPALAQWPTEETPADERVCGEESSMSCHSRCGGMAREARICSGINSYYGPFNETCLCSSNSTFMLYSDDCLECGWELWNNYGPFIQPGLKACGLPEEPTGARCPVASVTGAGNNSVATTTGAVNTTSSTDASSATSAAGNFSSTESSSSSAGAGNKITIGAGLVAAVVALLI